MKSYRRLRITDFRIICSDQIRYLVIFLPFSESRNDAVKYHIHSSQYRTLFAFANRQKPSKYSSASKKYIVFCDGKPVFQLHSSSFDLTLPFFLHQDIEQQSTSIFLGKRGALPLQWNSLKYLTQKIRIKNIQSDQSSKSIPVFT